MTHFNSALSTLERDASCRRWCFVPHDQVNSGFGPLNRNDPAEMGIVMVENHWHLDRRPYHRQKLALLIANGRHFALEQARRGIAVRYLTVETPTRIALESVIGELGPLEVMQPAEHELRVDLTPLIADGGLDEIEHEGWLSSNDDFKASQKPEPPWRMDAFYRHLRRKTGLLMEDGRPVGGKYSFDADNRKPWPGSPPAPSPPVFEPDEIDVEVADHIAERFPGHPGTVDLESLPTTKADAERLWNWAREQCMPLFGPYEDAMSATSRGLFHTRISGLLNLHRLLPRRIVADVTALDIPLPSKEGFLRQILGWREFVRHVHRATDGFRNLPGSENPPVADEPGDAGWGRWAGRTWDTAAQPAGFDGGAQPSFLGADRPLPPGFWPGRPTGFACLDEVVDDVWAEAYSHHITRLMVLANIATLLEISPRELTDWFWVAYLDAFDWVVEPNVLAMGSFSVGPLMTTKPYVSGAAYINRMSDYCESCTFNPKTNCPITKLYWAFLDRHRDTLAGNARMRLILSSLARRDPAVLAHDRAVFEHVSEVLATGGTLHPDTLPEVDDG